MSSGATRPQATAVICTLGSNPALGAAVAGLLGQTESSVRILVVDNDPRSGRARRQLEQFGDRITVVDEPRRGLSVARNRAIAACTTPLIAFTDDDAEPDPQWIEHLVDVFAVAPPDVVLVTGRVLPADDTEASAWFEEGFSFDRGELPQVWRWPDPVGPGWSAALDELLPEVVAGGQGAAFPISGGEFGSGNSMAFRVDWLDRHGGFDERLGAGTPTRGGEDLDVFRRVALDGAVAVYQPNAVIRHHHRPDLEALTAQSFGYGSGMSASVIAYALRHPRHLARTLAVVPSGAALLLDRSSPKNRRKSAAYPRRLDWAERAGYLAGPALLARSAWRTRTGRALTDTASTLP